MTKAERQIQMDRAAANRLAYLHQLLGQGKVSRAREYARTYSLKIDEAVFAAAKEGVVTATQPPQIVIAPPVVTPNITVSIKEIDAEQLPPPPTEPVADFSFGTPEPEVAPITEPPTEPPAEGFINGWPVRSMAKIWKRVQNPNYTMIKLADGRLASLYNIPGIEWGINCMVDVRLELANADPVYSWVKPRA